MIVNYNYKLKPFDHQAHALDTGWDRIEFGLFMEMGTGKSKVLIDNMGMLYQAGLIDFRFGHRTQGRLSQLGSQRNPRAYVR